MRNLKALLSPNRTSRCGLIPDVICCHQSGAPLEERLRLFSDPASLESVHYAVARSGEVYQVTDIGFAAMAFSGREAFPLAEIVKERPVSPDFYTVSVEFENERSGVLTKEQYLSGLDLLASLIRQIRESYGEYRLDRKHFIGHYEACPVSAVNCPGIDFPLNLYLADLKRLFGENGGEV